LSGVIPEIDIWRAANLLLKRYGEKALEESSTRAEELAADGDHDGAVTWRRITNAVVQLGNNVSPGPPH
jgi:triphosphoribosyl-dephospho-CoA synthetase